MPSSGHDVSAFSAAGPALGYLAQVDYALWAALERMDEEEDFSVSIETLDDVVFHDPGTGDATQKLQTKHTMDLDPFALGRERRSVEDVGKLDCRARGSHDPTRISRGRHGRAHSSVAAGRP